MMKESTQEQGFTLLEILIGLTVSALILVGLNQSMLIINRGFDQATVSIGRQSSIATGLYIVSGDITHIQRRVDNPENPRAFLFGGTASEIIYLLEERPGSIEGGLFWIRLYARNTPKGQELIRARKPFADEEVLPLSGDWQDETTLMRVDAEITFAYRATRSKSRDWQPGWSSPSQMPDQIRINITDKKTGRLRVPPFVQTLKQSAEAECAVPTAHACTLQSSGTLTGRTQ
jgi:prepilin-type N-terminal cleavage/methylation domain-containing protein